MTDEAMRCVERMREGAARCMGEKRFRGVHMRSPRRRGGACGSHTNNRTVARYMAHGGKAEEEVANRRFASFAKGKTADGSIGD